MSEEKLYQILRALATSSRKTLSIKSLMKQAGYREYKDFRRDLMRLKMKGLVDFRRSGFPSDSKSHRKLVILNAEPILVYNEPEGEPSPPPTERDLILPGATVATVDAYLVEVYTPLGHVSLQSLSDFLKLPLEEREKIFAGRVLDMRTGEYIQFPSAKYLMLEDDKRES